MRTVTSKLIIALLYFGYATNSVASNNEQLQACQTELQSAYNSGDDRKISNGQKLYEDCLWKLLDQNLAEHPNRQRIISALQSVIRTYPAMDIFCEEFPCGTMWVQVANGSKLRILEGAVKDTQPL